MKSNILLSGTFIILLFLTVGCGEKNIEKKSESKEQKSEIDDIPQVVTSNQLKGLPGTVYESQASSAIHWRPWTAESLQFARNARRMVLGVVAMPQYTSFKESLEILSADPTTVETINDKYIPILIDGDTSREMGLLVNQLCTENQIPPQLPLLIWMTPEGDPVAWIGIAPAMKDQMKKSFEEAHISMYSGWEERPEFVITHGREMREARESRITSRINNTASLTSTEPKADILRSFRQINTLYDLTSRTMDETGGVFPSSVLDFLAIGANLQGLPTAVSEKTLWILDHLLEDILKSPIFDPLEGGIFSSKKGQGWALPDYELDCSTQARAATALLNAYEKAPNPLALERALGALEFAKNRFQTEDGVYRLGLAFTAEAKNWLWWMNELGSTLSPQEEEIFTMAMGMKRMGNLPQGAILVQNYFKGNTLSNAKTATEIAKEKILKPEEVQALLDSAKKKILAARNERMKSATPTSSKGHAVSTFRMISAFATAYRVTGDDKYRKLAVETLTKAKTYFADGLGLKNYAGDYPKSITEGRAFLYALAMQAGLDVDAITLTGEELLWVGNLASTLSENFINDELLRENSLEADLIEVPISDTLMIFDESTLGIMSLNAARMEAQGINLVPALKTIVNRLPAYAASSPVYYTDRLQGPILREFGDTYIFDENAPQAIKEALTRLSFKTANRRASNLSDKGNKLPKDGEVLKISATGDVQKIDSIEALKL